MPTVIGYDDSVKLRCTCRNCSAIIEYVPKDVQEKLEHDYGGGSDLVYYMTCPSCGVRINGVRKYK
jgi:hypothetical protein